MNLLPFIMLAIAHLVCGYAILLILKKTNLSTPQRVSLGLVLGLGLSSFIPMLLEILHISISFTTLFISLMMLSLIPMAFALKHLKNEIVLIKKDLKKIKLYDIIICLAICLLLFVGSFKCYFFPPSARDLTSGAEVLAEYTLREGHINNSVFLQDLSSTNNHQKPPSVLGLQIIYKTFVQHFGQVWLIVLAYGFYFFFYASLRRIVHPLLAGILCILCISVPEVYAYIGIALFDFGNMIFVFLAYYFFAQYLFSHSNKKSDMILCGIMFAIAVFFRAETLLLVILNIPLLILFSHDVTKKINIKKKALDFLYMLLFPLLTYLVSMEYFVKIVLPSKFSTINQLNEHLSDFQPFFQRMNDILFKLMFNDVDNASNLLYHKTFSIALVFMLLETILIIISRKIFKQAFFWAMIFILLFIYIALIGYLFPLADLQNTSKRALFKLVPIVFIFIANTQIMQYISSRLSQWEQEKKAGLLKV